MISYFVGCVCECSCVSVFVQILKRRAYAICWFGGVSESSSFWGGGGCLSNVLMNGCFNMTDLHLWMRKRGDWAWNYVWAVSSIQWKIRFMEMRNIHIWYTQKRRKNEMTTIQTDIFHHCLVHAVCCVSPSPPRRYLKYKCLAAIKMKTPTKTAI